MKVTILGCGGSGGVPYVDGTPGGNWGACDPANPRNRRRRVSILVESAGTTVLVDTSPDLRAQFFDAEVRHLDAVVFTHAHADHAHGLDELRGFMHARGAPIDAYMDAETRRALTTRFDYAFASSCDPKSLYRPVFQDRVLDGPARIGALEVVPFIQGHGTENTLGLRFGPVAYSTDVVALDEPAFAALAGVQVWIVDCLRDRPHPTHSHVAQTLNWITRVKPARGILTHMNHQLDYEDLRRRCPSGVEPAYDGMVIDIEG
ncbi:MAG TPA: MBL fold metallo-hydrolase [Kiloniellales bacterium]